MSEAKRNIPESPVRLSLIERASQVYDFATELRTRTTDNDAPPPGSAVKIKTDVARHEDARVLTPAGPRTPLPVPGRVVQIDRTALDEMGFVHPDAPPTSLAEEFRIVKRQLLVGALGGQGASAFPRGRAILVCSAEPDEGKTYCAVNLALSMSKEKDIEVLLVDADFAKPEILSTLGIEGGPGLMDALADPTIDVEACVIRTDLGNLSVLPAGRLMNEATELLASEHTKSVFERLLSSHSRIVIFDSSPALAASSASVLAQLVGQVMMVVRADVTSESELREALGLLSSCDQVRLLLNAVQLEPHGRRFGAYYGYGV